MSAAPFLTGLMARAAATTMPMLRPDPWRGHEEAAPDAAPEAMFPAATPMPAAPAVPLRPSQPITPSRPEAAQADPVPPMPGPYRSEEPPPTIRQPVLPATREPAAASPPSAARQADAPELAAAAPRIAAMTREPASTPAAETIRPVETPGVPPLPRPVPALSVQPRIRPAAPLPAGEPAKEPPTIEINIGRIEWRAPAPQPAPRPSPPVPGPTGFAAFAALRAGLDRGRR